MRSSFFLVTLVLALSGASLLTSGCAVTQGRQTAKAYAHDKEIAARIKTAFYGDPTVKGTQVNVTVLNGNVQLSGFVDSQEEKDRAGQIATSTPGVVQVHNNLLLPTGRSSGAPAH